MNLQVGDHVMVFMPHEIQGKERTLVLPYRGQAKGMVRSLLGGLKWKLCP